MRPWINDYIEAQHRALDSIPHDAVEKLVNTVKKAWQDDRHIFAIGNGGNAANSSHFATDLGKGSSDSLGKRFRVMTLGDNLAWLTAIGNDYHFDDVFLRPLQNYAKPGDVVIATSVSGSSPNLVKAVEWARNNGVQTVALVGGKKGKLADLADQVIVINDTHYGRVEDAQMTILHMLCYAFMEEGAAK
ncbi:MAG: sugar isomerase [Planctomycetes bacterium SCN 63-9]|nr:MAG: sugar isomerase [Planctomycetes bacterium SCN 63-9]